MEETEKSVTLMARCEMCNGSGLDPILMGGGSTANICLDCKGSGGKPITFVPFSGRKVLAQVQKVMVPSQLQAEGSLAAFPDVMEVSDFQDRVPEASAKSLRIA